MESRNRNSDQKTVKNLDTRKPRFAGSSVAILALLAFTLSGCTGDFATVQPSTDPTAIVAVGSTPAGNLPATATPVPTASATPSPTPSATPVSLADCLASTQLSFDAGVQTQLTWYQAHGGVLPSERHRSALQKGTNGRAVILVHGFLSSPEAMKELGDEIAKEGYTVLRPLVTGYGAGDKAANAAGPDQWRQSVVDAVTLMKVCHSDVSILAHSLGGGITTDLITNRGLANTKLTHVILLAPYYHVASNYLQSILDTFLTFTDAITLDDIRGLIPGDPYEFLGVERPAVGEPEPFLPLLAGQKVLDLQDVFDATLTAGILRMPKVLLAVSQADAVINSKFAVTYATARFGSLATISYPKSEGIIHSFENRAANPHFDDLKARILAHLLQ